MAIGGGVVVKSDIRILAAVVIGRAAAVFHLHCGAVLFGHHLLFHGATAAKSAQR